MRVLGCVLLFYLFCLVSGFHIVYFYVFKKTFRLRRKLPHRPPPGEDGKTVERHVSVRGDGPARGEKGLPASGRRPSGVPSLSKDRTCPDCRWRPWLLAYLSLKSWGRVQGLRENGSKGTSVRTGTFVSNLKTVVGFTVGEVRDSVHTAVERSGSRPPALPSSPPPLQSAGVRAAAATPAGAPAKAGVGRGASKSSGPVVARSPEALQ